MGDAERSRGERQRRPGSEEELVARLLRLAGRRPRVPAERAIRVEAAVRARWRELLRERRRRRAALWAGGSLAAALLLVAGLLVRRQGAGELVPSPLVVARLERTLGSVRAGDGAGARRLGPGEEITAGAVVTTGPRARAAFRAPGGASVRLDVASRLRFGSPGLLVLERGAIYLDSGRAGGSALAVRTELGVVREVGTQFEVRLGEGVLRVRVREGAVEVRGEGEPHAVGAGVELAVSSRGAVSRAAVPRHGPHWAWVTEIAPAFRLEGKTLAEFLAWVARETGWEVRLRGEGLPGFASSVVLHGSVEELPPDQALAAVLPTCGLTHRRQGAVLEVLPLPGGGPGR